MSAPIDGNVLAAIARELDQTLASWFTEIIEKRGAKRILRAAVTVARAIARDRLGVRALSREQARQVAVMAQSHLEGWKLKARR